MLRRSHKKSKGGCKECKRRHVKCDEERPRCRLCTISDQVCSFASSTAHSSPSAKTSSLPLSTFLEKYAKTTTADEVSPALHGDLADSNEGKIAVEENINFNHMELLFHATLSDDMYNLAVGFDKVHRFGIYCGLETAMKAPYLMHQMLAYSACHLAHMNADRAVFYQNQAVAHQTRAISNFNSLDLQIDRTTCVPTLLFSSILGMHMLAETLLEHPLESLEEFIDRYVRCARMQRGIHTIAVSAWPMLMESHLAPILTLSQSFTSRKPYGDDCDHVRLLVDESLHLSESERHVCRSAIKYLQVGLDAAQSTADGLINPYQMICEWTILVPPEFTNLLAERKPEALLVLAHYGVLLHYGRHLWQVQDAGRRIVDMIDIYLGPAWSKWMGKSCVHVRSCNRIPDYV